MFWRRVVEGWMDPRLSLEERLVGVDGALMRGREHVAAARGEGWFRIGFMAGLSIVWGYLSFGRTMEMLRSGF